MGIEAATYVGDLNITNPAATDGKAQGDNHLRLIKAAVKNTLPGFAGAALVTGTVGGTANAITITPATALASYTAGVAVRFIPTSGNTGAVTVNVSGLGDVTLKTVDGAALEAGDLVSGNPVEAHYTGTDFRLRHPTKRYVDQLAFSAALPLQAGNSGFFVTTNGTSASWVAPTVASIADYASDQAAKAATARALALCFAASLS